MNIRRLLGLPSKPDEALIDWMRDPGDPRTAYCVIVVRDARGEA